MNKTFEAMDAAQASAMAAAEMAESLAADAAAAEQGTAEWLAHRCGKVTGSRVADIMRKTKTGISATRANYLAELVAERLTGVPAEHYKSAAIQWGTDCEPAARAAYEFELSCEVEPIGFVRHPKIPDFGASPDGLVGRLGQVEIKCPLTATHLAFLTGAEKIANDYIVQMQAGMACTGRAWCDFVSFDPRLPPDLQLVVQRVPRDDAFIAELEKSVLGFLDELAQMLAKLAAYRDRASMPAARSALAAALAASVAAANGAP